MSSTARLFAQPSRDAMDQAPGFLLCIDLQVDRPHSLNPAPQAIFGARQVLTMGRRLGWTIAHVRRSFPVDPSAPAPETLGAPSDVRAGAMRPLMSERVFFRSGRSILESAGLRRLLDRWRNETVFVAGFDYVALLSCLLACYENGPRIVLVDDVVTMSGLPGHASIEAFRTAARHLAAGWTTISEIAAEADGRPLSAFAPFPSPVGAGRQGMPV